MTGDQNDIVSRLLAVLPKRWFPDSSPNLIAILSCIAVPWAWLYDLIVYVIAQTRLKTASDGWLDLIALDYFGRALKRRLGEKDASYRARIQAALLQKAATRSAVSAGLEALTGLKPQIFEPLNCMDTGGYAVFENSSGNPSQGMAYGQVGGWGNLNLPLQVFITATRAPLPGIDSVAGYGSPIGGYGSGAITYVDLALLPGYVSDEDVQATLCNLLPVNVTAWLRIN